MQTKEATCGSIFSLIKILNKKKLFLYITSLPTLAETQNFSKRTKYKFLYVGYQT